MGRAATGCAAAPADAMLIAAFIALAAAVALGAALAVRYLRTATAAAPSSRVWPLAALHGLLGIGGLCCLLLALRGPPRGVALGVGSFGAISAGLLTLAALAGLTVLFVHRVKRRRAATLIGLHATLAVSGFVILAAYLLV
jgi:hypothetical protein